MGKGGWDGRDFLMAFMVLWLMTLTGLGQEKQQRVFL